MSDVPEPFPHQVQGVRWALRHLASHKGAYLNHAVGTGKSRTAIGIARNLDPAPKRVLILAPPVVLGVWKREIARWWGKDVLILGGGDWAAQAGRLWGVNVAVTNYEKLVGPSGEARLKTLLRWKPDLLILDEAHMVKSPTAQRSRAVAKLVKGSHKVLLLSGTPAHTPLDWWAQYRLIAPDDPCWARPFGQFKDEIAVMGGPEGNWVQGFKPEVQARVAREHVLPYTHVVPAGVLDLPEPLETPVTFALSPKEQQAYDDMARDLLAEVDDGTVEASNALVKVLRLQQICSGFAGSPPLKVGTSKVKALLALLEPRAHVPVVIAYRFTQEVQEIQDALKWEGSIIAGSTRPEARTQIEDDFQQGKIPVLLLQYRAGGVGITLSKAHTLILYSQEPSCIQDTQMRGRVWRPGQTGHVQVIPLMAEGTVEERLYAGLQKKLEGISLARFALGR